MEKRIHHLSEYTKAAFFYSLISIAGSILSVINALPLMVTYQLIRESHQEEPNHFVNNILTFLFIFSLISTIIITIIYLNILL